MSSSKKNVIQAYPKPELREKIEKYITNQNEGLTKGEKRYSNSEMICDALHFFFNHKSNKTVK